jgi:esterase/lipase
MTGEARAAVKSSDRIPAKRKRSPAFRLLLVLARSVIAVIVVTALFNAFMYYTATREADRIADTPYGRAFESVDYEGEGDAGVLLLHGIYGTPYDFHHLTDLLRKEGISHYAPMLGGDRPTPLAGIGYTKRSLAHHAQQAYEHLSLRSKRIVIVGLSLGAVQATDLAARHEVQGLVVVSPGYRIAKRWYLRPNANSLAKRFGAFVPLIPGGKPVWVNDESEVESYRGLTTWAVQVGVALRYYSRDVLRRVGDIKAPVLAVLSRGDSLTDLDLAKRAIEGMASAETRFVWYERSDHSLLVDHDREAATREIFDFLTTHLDLQTAE